MIIRNMVDMLKAVGYERPNIALLSMVEKVSFPMDTIRKYFPRSYTPKRMQETIIKLLEAWQKKRQRSQER